jgi:DNA-binding MarR family transcriptional regulator
MDARAAPRPCDPPSARGSPPPLDRTLSYRLHLLTKLTDRTSQRAYLALTGLSMSDGRCLAAIGRFEPLSVTDLAMRANLTKGQASRAAQALVDQALVRKQDSPDDARGVVLTLTPAGRRAWKRTMALVVSRNDEILGCLSPAERTQFGALLDRLIAHARAR